MNPHVARRVWHVLCRALCGVRFVIALLLWRTSWFCKLQLPATHAQRAPCAANHMNYCNYEHFKRTLICIL